MSLQYSPGVRQPLPIPGEEPSEVCSYARQEGNVIFINANPVIMYIRGADNILYVTNDRHRVKKFAERFDVTRDTRVFFVPVVGAGNYVACRVQLPALPQNSSAAPR